MCVTYILTEKNFIVPRVALDKSAVRRPIKVSDET